MKRTTLILLLFALFVFFVLWSFGSSAATRKPTARGQQDPSPENISNVKPAHSAPQTGQSSNDEVDPDLPRRLSGKIDKATYLQMREEYIARRRGVEPGLPYDPEA